MLFKIGKVIFFFFFNDTATTEIYTLSLHDALPISARCAWRKPCAPMSASRSAPARSPPAPTCWADRKSTRLNSSHSQISYAVFCLKKKKHPISDRKRQACLLWQDHLTAGEQCLLFP